MSNVLSKISKYGIKKNIYYLLFALWFVISVIMMFVNARKDIAAFMLFALLSHFTQNVFSWTFDDWRIAIKLRKLFCKVPFCRIISHMRFHELQIASVLRHSFLCIGITAFMDSIISISCFLHDFKLFCGAFSMKPIDMRYDCIVM